MKPFLKNTYRTGLLVVFVLGGVLFGTSAKERSKNTQMLERITAIEDARADHGGGDGDVGGTSGDGGSTSSSY